MPCDLRVKEEERRAALQRLEEQLKSQEARLVDVFGRIEIVGWTGDRAGFCDACALAALGQSNDPAVRQQLLGLPKGQRHTH